MSGAQTRRETRRIIELQDWDNEALVGFLLEFVDENELEEELLAYLADKADEENEGCETLHPA